MNRTSKLLLVTMLSLATAGPAMAQVRRPASPGPKPNQGHSWQRDPKFTIPPRVNPPRIIVPPAWLAQHNRALQLQATLPSASTPRVAPQPVATYWCEACQIRHRIDSKCPKAK